MYRLARLAEGRSLAPNTLFPLGGRSTVGCLVPSPSRSESWLAHYLNFSGERLLPPLAKLLDQPFWLDPRDPHQMAAVMQVTSRPLAHDYTQALGNWRHDGIWEEFTWAKAIHRVAAEGISPEQAVDEAITRIKQILAE
jgi:multiple sugar transport system substrate-binding protein